MDSLASAVEKARGLAKSSCDFVSGLFRRRENSSRRNPIEILKRLQRESFSDIMKLRDRQEKVERVLSFYKSSKGGPFQEASTHVRGEVDVLGAVLLMGNVDNEQFDALDKAGIRPGIRSRFTFETNVRQKDLLVAELVANQKGGRQLGDVSASQLSLAKVLYMANVSDWFSAIAIPIGAQFRDIDAAANPLHQGSGLTDFSAFGPPLLNHENGSAVGLTVRQSNIVASLAQSISELQVQPAFTSVGHCFSTFGQVICQLPRGIKLSLLGLHQVPKSPSNNFLNRGAISIPISSLRRRRATEATAEQSAPPTETSSLDCLSTGSIALRLDSELDDFMRIGGWVEIKNSNPKHLQWSVSVSDNFEDESGWGVSVGGIIDGPRNWDQFQFELYQKFNLGKKYSLKPGFTCVQNGNGRTIALMLRSNWFF